MSEQLADLQTRCQQGQLGAEDMARFGRLLRLSLDPPNVEGGMPRVLVLGQCTTTWLADCIAAVAWQHGTPVRLTDGPYDSVIQSLASLAETGERPDVVVMVPWAARLIESGRHRVTARAIADEISYWRTAWDKAQSLGAHIVQVGYDTPLIGPRGQYLEGAPGGSLHFIREVNAQVRSSLPSAAFFVDLERLAGDVGRKSFYDSRRYAWTKQPFSEDGVLRLAEATAAGIRTLRTGPKKVLVVDLDNTLWGGVVGDEGPLNIAIGDSPDGEAFSAFQRHLKELARRGVLLAICSKNDHAIAVAPFLENDDMVLKLSDFVAVEASWDLKSSAIKRISTTLNLGLDSFVFFDDSPFERSEVKGALPEVAVVPVPEDSADYIAALESGYYFEALGITSEDTSRTEQYRTEGLRRAAGASAGTTEDFLSSLGLEGTTAPIVSANIARVSQLLGKTNQFNLTTRRHSADTLAQMVATAGGCSFAMHLKDKFGDYGLVSALIALPRLVDGEIALVIDSWVMSCRVIARTLEHFALNHLVSEAMRLGYREIVGEFIPTDKNALVSDLFPRLGFLPVKDSCKTGMQYKLSVPGALAQPTSVARALSDEGLVDSRDLLEVVLKEAH